MSPHSNWKNERQLLHPANRSVSVIKPAAVAVVVAAAAAAATAVDGVPQGVTFAPLVVKHGDGFHVVVVVVAAAVVVNDVGFDEKLRLELYLPEIWEE